MTRLKSGVRQAFVGEETTQPRMASHPATHIDTEDHLSPVDEGRAGEDERDGSSTGVNDSTSPADGRTVSAESSVAAVGATLGSTEMATVLRQVQEEKEETAKRRCFGAPSRTGGITDTGEGRLPTAWEVANKVVGERLLLGDPGFEASLRREQHMRALIERQTQEHAQILMKGTPNKIAPIRVTRAEKIQLQAADDVEAFLAGEHEAEAAGSSKPSASRRSGASLTSSGSSYRAARRGSKRSRKEQSTDDGSSPTDL
jgi:hypothetical protein